jgi:hypothetical protein
MRRPQHARARARRFVARCYHKRAWRLLAHAKKDYIKSCSPDNDVRRNMV